MNCIIPFTKNIKFNTNISEIVSISLENEYTVNDNEILGNFIVSGDYKSHEVSVNKEHFEQVLPFSVNLTTRIDTESVDFAIEDFTYEIIDNDTLKVNIEYSINAIEAREEDVFEPVAEESVSLDDILDSLDSEIDERKESETLEETEPTEPNDFEETKESEEETVDTEVIDKPTEVRDNELTEQEQNTVIDSISKEDSFVTYHIHVMQEVDTLESVCAKYNTTASILGEYNDLSTIAIGDKLIIPEINE